MNNTANKTTFWSFLKKSDIRVPIIQRDYAQGRKGKEVLRANFLAGIVKAMNGGRPLKLDFVYGSGDGEGHFLPLDGQQRLTTLWLLHWYLAYKAGEIANPDVREVMLRFSYETRESSKSFIRKLVEEGEHIQQKSGETISDAILRQSWMYTLWRQDPTVQSMLRMLSGECNDKIDGIEKAFLGKTDDEFKLLWKKLLLETGSCPVIFYQLDIENMGQNDDLYLKMNGRGKSLTDFENFKADLLKYFGDQSWEDFLDAENGYPILMDTKWTDFFWAYRKPEIEFDDLYFNFINRYFLIVLMRYVPDLESFEKGSKERAVYDYLYSFIEAKKNRPSYTVVGFGLYEDFFNLLQPTHAVKDMFANLKLMMVNISSYYNDHGFPPVNSPYYERKTFTPVYVHNEQSSAQDYYSLTQPQLVAFWAVCYYFERDAEFQDQSLKQWMRLVWNICDFNGETRSKQDVISAIQDLAKLVENPTTPYTSLIAHQDESEQKESVSVSTEKSPLKKLTSFNEHVLEERVKIIRMTDPNNMVYNGEVEDFKKKSWEDVVLQVEKNKYLSGTIRCLLLNENGEYSWDNFDKKYQHFIQYQNMNEVAARNYLIYDYSRLAEDYWYPDSVEENLRHWQTLLSQRKYSRYVDKWLLAEPLDEESLKSYCVSHKFDYEKSQIIGTGLLRKAAHNKGIYLATSGACGGKRVLIHHQASMPYVVMYETRNQTLLNLINSGTIELLSPDNMWSEVDMYNGKDVGFEYGNARYTWTGAGLVFMQGASMETAIMIEDRVYDLNEFQQFMSNLPIKDTLGQSDRADNEGTV